MTITKPDGETTVKTVRIWNETVSNLTLMALGSSAPEILLSVIEVLSSICYKHKQTPLPMKVQCTLKRVKNAISLLI